MKYQQSGIHKTGRYVFFMLVGSIYHGRYKAILGNLHELEDVKLDDRVSKDLLHMAKYFKRKEVKGGNKI